MSAVETQSRQAKPRGAAKKEAFHRLAEANVKTFTFSENVLAEDPTRVNINLASLDSCHARLQVLRKGATKRKLHYHPNQDQIYMVLKGRIRLYGPDDAVAGELGAFEGVVYPENSRYWLENAADGETWLLHFSAFPKGAKAARAIDVPPGKARKD